MATDTSSQNETTNSSEDNPDRLKTLYPAVDEEETPLPRSWSPKDKFSFIGLSQNNLRVHYKGTGKSHKDAASVRATHPIPASCGIYYFEVKVISKGRDGYMGIGLSTQGVSMNRLPGWDKHAYGYHGDDGNSFCSSGAGQPYGPTFTTGDTIGCCLNLIDKTCFYTKNGVSLGVAFTDLPANLYPTVGLQTPGEVVEANFGQTPFMFDILDYMKEWKMKTKQAIERFSVSDKKGEFQSALHKIVSTYLVHHGYCSAAEAFSKSTGQPIMESIESIRNRQRIQKLVLAGRMGEAIETTQKLYPHLLETKPDLLFMLKCRQFVEMVNGTDSEVRGGSRAASSTNSSPTPSSNNNSNSSVGGHPMAYSNNSIHAITPSTHSRSPKSHYGAGGGGGGGGGDSSGSNRSSPAHSPHPYHRSGTPPSSSSSSSLSQHHHSHHQQHHQQQPHHHQSTSPSSRTTPTNSASNSPNRPCSHSSSNNNSSSGGNSKTQGRQSPSFSSSVSLPLPTTTAMVTNPSTTTTTQVLSLSSSSTLPPPSSSPQHPYNNNNSVNGTSSSSIPPSTTNNRLDSSDPCPDTGMNSSNEFVLANNNKSSFPPRYIQDGDDVDMVAADKSPISNGTTPTPIANGGTDSHNIAEDEDMDVDTPSSQRPLMCGGNEVAIEKMLAFGRDLKMMSQRLRKDYGKNEANKKTLQDAFSLLAYSDPWNSPIGSQLLPVKREPVCAALNSAILESKGLPKQPPLELALSQAGQCVRLMAKSGIGSCAFASVTDYLH